MTEKRIKTSDVIGNSYYNYTLTSTNNTPSINSTISITCSVTDIYGQSVSGKSITLYLNGVSQGARTTASNGSATWSNITMSTGGLQVFSVENSKIEVFVDNKSEVGHTHSNYLTSSDISGKANSSDLGAVAFSNNYNDLNNKPSIPTQVIVDTTLLTTSNNAIANSTVKNTLDNKLDKTHTSYKGKNVVTNSSTGTIEFEEKNNHTHSQYLIEHQDISGKIDTAGTGLSKTGTTLNHSNSITAQTTNAFKKFKYDAQGHITGITDVLASDLPSHTHSQYLTEHQSLDNYVTKETGKGLFSGSYSDLTNKPSYTPSITSTTTGSYKIGSINISGSSVDIYGKDTDTTPPSASTITPSADTASGSYGSGTTYARANHAHPKSSIYAEASHNHNTTEITDSTAYTNIGSSANATQKAINDAINAKLASWTWKTTSPYSGVTVYYNDFLVCVVISGSFQSLSPTRTWIDMESTGTPIDANVSVDLKPPTNMACKSDGTSQIFIRIGGTDGVIQAMHMTGTQSSSWTGRAIFTYKRK